MCQATNTFNGDMGMANKTIDFYVLCKLVNKAKWQIGTIQGIKFSLFIYGLLYSNPNI